MRRTAGDPATHGGKGGVVKREKFKGRKESRSGEEIRTVQGGLFQYQGDVVVEEWGNRREGKHRTGVLRAQGEGGVGVSGKDTKILRRPAVGARGWF